MSEHTEAYVRLFTGVHRAEKQYQSPLVVGDTVRITGEEYHGQVGELKVIDPLDDEEGDIPFGVYLDSVEAIVFFGKDDIKHVSPEQALLDEAVARAIALGRPFTEDEVLAPAWEAGYELTPEMIDCFVLVREATKKTRRLWNVVDMAELPF